jgi:hypothetical protein
MIFPSPWLYNRGRVNRGRRCIYCTPTCEPSSAGDAHTAADASSATRARWTAIRDSGCTPCPAAVASRSKPQARRAAASPMVGAACWLEDEPTMEKMVPALFTFPCLYGRYSSWFIVSRTKKYNECYSLWMQDVSHMLVLILIMTPANTYAIELGALSQHSRPWDREKETAHFFRCALCSIYCLHSPSILMNEEFGVSYLHICRWSKQKHTYMQFVFFCQIFG